MNALANMVATYKPCTHEQFEGEKPYEFHWTESEIRELNTWEHRIWLEVMREAPYGK